MLNIQLLKVDAWVPIPNDGRLSRPMADNRLCDGIALDGVGDCFLKSAVTPGAQAAPFKMVQDCMLRLCVVLLMPLHVTNIMCAF